MYMSHVIAGMVQQHIFGRSQPSVHCLIGRGGVAERKDSGAACNNKASPPKQDSVVQAQPGPDTYCNSDKAKSAKSNTEREEKQPEGCEQDPKSMEESEEKPPEGYNKASQASDS